MSQYFPPLANIFETLVNRIQVTPWTLSSIRDFPFNDWSTMQAYYLPLKQWYDGTPLSEVVADRETGELVPKYPIRLNPIPRTCEKHVSVLFGHTLESIRQGGMPIQFLPEMEEKTDTAKIETLKKALSAAFGNGGGAMFVSNALVSQYMGGCVFEVEFHDNDEERPLRVRSCDVDEFFGIPKDGDPWSLRDAWHVREITKQDAEEKGYIWNKMDIQFFYVEHWTLDKHTIHVNEHEVKKETNPFGLIPFIYIPHIRTKDFIGKSIISEAVKGLIKEWNLRFADVGDAVSDDTHTEIGIRGVRGNVKEQVLPSGRKVSDLGSSVGMGVHDTQPDMIAVKTQSAAEPHLKFIDKIETQYRKEVNHPAVADGEDEGSQRSAATLITRMWPLVSHIELERIFWTSGMLALARMILDMYRVKGLFDVTDEMVRTNFTIKWATPLPRDRETLINELSIRKKNGMTSLWHILELLGDVENIELEIQKINQDADEAAKREAAYSKPPGNFEGKNNQEAGDRTNTDAGNIKTDD